jgi:hypothetical protein
MNDYSRDGWELIDHKIASGFNNYYLFRKEIK